MTEPLRSDLIAPRPARTDAFVPLSVRYGGRRKKLGWWLKGRREALALRLAPWLAHNKEG